MASKVCPVCKAFSSSSNTTLNAHIDGCLSEESTIKRTSKVTKHRIKPRKTRLMVDIYETARHCTLEDLDRRNGTNWATNLDSPAGGLVASAKENKKKHPVNIEGDKEVSVYIDPKGTKQLRILSKSSDPLRNSKTKDDCGSRKLTITDEGSKFRTNKWKDHLVQKHRLSKIRCHGQRSSYSGLEHCFEANHGQQRRFPPEEGYRNEDPTHQEQVVGPKKTSIEKKMNSEHKNQYEDKTPKKFSKSNLTSVGDTYVKRTNESNPRIVLDIDPHLHERNETLSCNSRDRCEKQPCEKKSVGISLLGSQNFHVSKKRFVQDMNPSTSNKNRNSPRNSKKMGANTSAVGDSDGSFISSRMPQHHASALEKRSLNCEIRSEGKKFSSKKNLLPVRHASVPESKKNCRRKHLDFKKPTLHGVSGPNEEVLVSRPAIYSQDNLVEIPRQSSAQAENGSGESFVNRTKIFKRKRKRSISTCQDTALKSSDTFGSDTHGSAMNIDLLVSHNVASGTLNVLDAMEGVENQNELTVEPSSNTRDGEAVISFHKSLSSTFPVSSDVECVSQHDIKAYEDHPPSWLVRTHEKKMSCADKVGEDLINDNTRVMAELDATEGQGKDFVEDDPIPSHGYLCSEELEANSSLTTCRIQRSHEDEQAFFDVNSSYCPVVLEKEQTPELGRNVANPQTGYSEGRELLQPSPSTSSYVLRLMGKDIMVMNKDDNCLLKLGLSS